MSGVLLEVDDVHRRFDGIKALRGFSCAWNRGNRWGDWPERRGEDYVV